LKIIPLIGLLLRAEKDKRMRLQDEPSSFDEVLVLKMKIFYCLASFSDSAGEGSRMRT
jgi:hypothetical protein